MSRALNANRGNLTMSDEQARLLDLTYKSFVRTGAQLQGGDRGRYAVIAEKLASLEAQFAQNVLADESSFVLELDENDLAGVSSDVKATAAQTAIERKTAKPFALTLSRSECRAFPQPGRKARFARGTFQGLDRARRARGTDG